MRILRNFEDSPIVIIPNLYFNIASISISFDNVKSRLDYAKLAISKIGQEAAN